ncbi:hypothetical protein KEM56_007306 [Ascosphaera pollenicola]|nr:hypothetical protein KEM56_007306 [Ascosphaera pollenicola]
MVNLKWLEVPHDGGIIPDRWSNNDVKPTEKERRNWGFWTYHNYWVLVNSNISTYMTGSSLVAMGMSWWEAFIAICVGNLIVTVLVILNSLPGAYYHIGFPVVNRSVWVWYGFQAWIGGECVYVCLQAIWPSIEHRIPNHMPESTGMTTASFVAYIIFMVLSIPVIYVRPHKLQTLFYISSAIILVFEVALLIWALATMGPEGFGDTMRASGSGVDGWNIVYGIVSTVGAIAAGILNQNDYARFSRKPRDAVYGQIFSIAPYGIICCLIGILVTGATEKRYGEALWNLPDLLSAIIETGGSRSRAAAFFSGFALVISQMGVNIPGNALSGGFDLAAILPKYMNIRRGAYITVLLSIACNPWKLVNTSTVFLSVMSSYSVFLGPMIGVMISSYLIVNRQKLKIDDLFVGNRSSIYWFTGGCNWRAFIAWAMGTWPSLPGFVASVNEDVTVAVGWTHLYQICFLTAVAISSTVYAALHYIFSDKPQVDWIASAPPAKVCMQRYETMVDEAVKSPDGSLAYEVQPPQKTEV